MPLPRLGLDLALFENGHITTCHNDCVYCALPRRMLCVIGQYHMLGLQWHGSLRGLRLSQLINVLQSSSDLSVESIMP